MNPEQLPCYLAVVTICLGYPGYEYRVCLRATYRQSGNQPFGNRVTGKPRQIVTTAK